MIGEPLLNHAIEGGLHLAGEAHAVHPAKVEVGFHLVAQAPLLDQGSERQLQTQVVEGGRAELHSDGLQLDRDAVRQAFEIGDPWRLLRSGLQAAQPQQQPGHQLPQ